MVTQIPSMCLKCGIAFFSSSTMLIPQGGEAVLSGDNLQGPCPKCGGMGLIPNGTYRNIGAATLFNAASQFDLELIQRLLGIAKSAVESNENSDEFLAAAKKESPLLDKLWALYPTDPKLRLDWWRNVIALLALIVAYHYSSQKSNQVQSTVPPEFVEVIRSLNQSPPASDPVKKNRRARRTEQRRKWQSA